MFNRRPRAEPDPLTHFPNGERIPTLADPPPPKTDQHGYMTPEYTRWELQQAELRQNGGVWPVPKPPAVDLDAQIERANQAVQEAARLKAQLEQQWRDALGEGTDPYGRRQPDVGKVSRLEGEIRQAAQVLADAKEGQSRLRRRRRAPVGGGRTSRNVVVPNDGRMPYSYNPARLVDGKYEE